MNHRLVAAIRTSAILAMMISCLGVTMSCSQETREALGELTALRKAVKEQFSCQDVGVVLMNGHILRITLINSPYPEMSAAELQATAAHAVRFASDHYGSVAVVDTMQVMFTQSQTHYFVFTRSRSYGPFSFAKVPSVDGPPGWQPQGQKASPQPEPGQRSPN